MTIVCASGLLRFKAEAMGAATLDEEDLKRLVVHISGFGLFTLFDIFRIDALARWLAS